MKVIIFTCLVSMAYAALGPGDVIDLDKIRDPQKAAAYIDCLLDKKECTKEMQEFKNRINQVGGFGSKLCQNCSAAQLANLRQSFKILFTEHPERLQELRAKYNPDGSTYDKFIAEALRQ